MTSNSLQEAIKNLSTSKGLLVRGNNVDRRSDALDAIMQLAHEYGFRIEYFTNENINGRKLHFVDTLVKSSSPFVLYNYICNSIHAVWSNRIMKGSLYYPKHTIYIIDFFTWNEFLRFSPYSGSSISAAAYVVMKMSSSNLNRYGMHFILTGNDEEDLPTTVLSHFHHCIHSDYDDFKLE